MKLPRPTPAEVARMRALLARQVEPCREWEQLKAALRREAEGADNPDPPPPQAA